MKIIALLLIVSGIATIFIPSFYSCAAHGKSIQLPGGKNIQMKCFWTARAEIAMGILLLVTGVFLFMSRNFESRRFLSVLAIMLAVLIILFPTTLIGVCANPDMLCALLMKPILLLIGAVAGVLGIAATAWSFTAQFQKE